MKSLFTQFFKNFLVCMLSCLYACGGASIVKNESLVPKQQLDQELLHSFNRAVVFMDAQKYQSAIDILKKINEKNNNLAGVHANIGIAYGALGQYNKAQIALQDAAKLNENNISIMHALALAHRNMGDFNASKKIYVKILAKNPNNPIARLNLGILCDIYINDVTCALQQYRAYEAIYVRPVDTQDVESSTKTDKLLMQQYKASHKELGSKNHNVVHWIEDLERRKHEF